MIVVCKVKIWCCVCCLYSEVPCDIRVVLGNELHNAPCVPCWIWCPAGFPCWFGEDPNRRANKTLGVGWRGKHRASRMLKAWAKTSAPAKGGSSTNTSEYKRKMDEYFIYTLPLDGVVSVPINESAGLDSILVLSSRYAARPAVHSFFQSYR